MPSTTHEAKKSTTKSSSAAPHAQSVSAELAAGVAQFLAPVVIDLEAVVVNGKQVHWHVRGKNFIGVHELIDVVVAHAQSYADVAAERVIALGLPIDVRLETVASKTTVPGLPDGFQQSEDSVAQLVMQLDAALATVREAVEGLDEIDPNSQDVAIEIERGLVKDRWLLVAHIAA